ncbi:hypothetical protein MMC16_002556 [Acarospora aff. strigata]|nr:hypothetical protein [Acarospora aff. strigata]
MANPADLTAPSAEDILIPILIATNPDIKLDYKKMSALDGTKTAASFEHRFRKYRARAKEIVAAKGGDPAVAGGAAVLEGLVPVTPSKKRVKKAVTSGSGGSGDGDRNGDVGEGNAGEETPKAKRIRAPKGKGEKGPATPKTPRSRAKGKKVQEQEHEQEMGDVMSQEPADGGYDDSPPTPGKDLESFAGEEEGLQDMSFVFEG